MTTSASVDFSVSRDNLIGDALRMVGAIGPDDTPTTNQVTHAARILNMVAKSWQSYGCQLWARKVGFLLPQEDVNEINLGPTGEHATTSYTITTLASAAVSGASTVVVSSATGITTTYNIGVELDSGDIDWTTVNGAPSGTTVTLTAELTGAAASGNFVYVYQTKIQRPLRILEAYNRIYTTATAYTEYEIDVMPKQEYEMLGNKTTEGFPVMISYDPYLDNGRAYIYPRFANGDVVIKIVFQRPYEDFDASGDTPDFPSEWYLALMYGLAVVLAPVYGMPVQDRTLLKQEAHMVFTEALSNEPEEGSFQIQPDTEDF